MIEAGSGSAAAGEKAAKLACGLPPGTREVARADGTAARITPNRVIRKVIFIFGYKPPIASKGAG